jgi:hypothetical protein
LPLDKRQSAGKNPGNLSIKSGDFGSSNRSLRPDPRYRAGGLPDIKWVKGSMSSGIFE